MTQESPGILALDRIIDGTISTGSETGDLLAVNLQDRQLTKIWSTDTTDPTQTWVACDFGQGRPIDCVAMLGHNWSQAAKWRVRIGNDPTFAATVYDSGLVKAWPTLGQFGVLPWGLWNWGDLLSAAEAAFYRIPSLILLDDPAIGRYIRVDVSDSANADGVIEAGRLLASQLYRPSWVMDNDWAIQWNDASTLDKSYGGQTWADERPRWRSIQFQLSMIEEREMYANVFDYLDRRKGIVGEILFIPQPTRPELFIHEVIYGHLKTLDGISRPNAVGRTRKFSIEELI